MAGQPQKRLKLAAIREQLEKRAREHECDSVLEYLEMYIGDGQFITQLTKDVSKATGMSISRAHVQRAVTEYASTDNGEQRLAVARNKGLRAMMEDTLTIADAATTDNVNVAKLQIEARRNLAQMLDPSLSPNRGGVNVNISLGQLHLDALRHRAMQTDEQLARARVSLDQPAEVISIATVSSEQGDDEGAASTAVTSDVVSA